MTLKISRIPGRKIKTSPSIIERLAKPHTLFSRLAPKAEGDVIQIMKLKRIKRSLNSKRRILRKRIFI